MRCLEESKPEKAQNREERERERASSSNLGWRGHDVIAKQRHWIDMSRSTRMFNKSSHVVHRRGIKGCLNIFFRSVSMQIYQIMYIRSLQSIN